MQDSQQRLSSSQSSREDLVVRINKRAALLLLAGMTVIAAVLLWSFRLNDDRNKAPVIAQAALNSAAPAPSAQANISTVPQESPSVTPPVPITETPPAAEPPAADQAANYPPSAPQPLTTVAVSKTIIKYYPPSPDPSVIPQPDSTSPDSPSPEKPSEPKPASDPKPAPGPPDTPNDLTAPAVINGAGATFPYPLYSKWFDEFHNLHPNAQFNYQPVGSGAGIKQLLENMTDFGATDEPMSDAQLARAKIPILHVPSVIGALVPSYNVPGVGELRFTPEILAGIYSGKLVYWNDRAIAAANPTANLPSLLITVIHRSDGSAATFIFTDYLSKISPDWQHAVGMGTSVNWPVGLGAIRNEGVADLLKQTPGAIGYLDFIYAVQNQLVFGSVRNLRGKFVKADLASLTAAGVLPDVPTDFRVSITNAPGRDAYPICSFTWFLAPVRSQSSSDARDLAAFFRWMLASSSQATASGLGYAPLPRELAARIIEEISKIH